MNKQELFDKCIKEAISLGRKYMWLPDVDQTQPTKQEWELALILFKKELK